MQNRIIFLLGFLYNFNDDEEAAPIYRCNGKVSQPTRPCDNHGLHIEHIPTWTESECKQQMHH